METITLRHAWPSDVAAIAALVNGFAGANMMLPRTAAEIALVVDDYVVATDARGQVIGCGALKQYSPSLAEVASIAVAREAQGRGFGSRMVMAVEELARMRGYGQVFLFTVTPRFFETLGYTISDRAAYPEKICTHGVSIARCGGCEKECMWRDLSVRELEIAA